MENSSVPHFLHEDAFCIIDTNQGKKYLAGKSLFSGSNESWQQKVLGSVTLPNIPSIACLHREQSHDFILEEIKAPYKQKVSDIYERLTNKLNSRFINWIEEKSERLTHTDLLTIMEQQNNSNQKIEFLLENIDAQTFSALWEQYIEDYGLSAHNFLRSNFPNDKEIINQIDYTELNEAIDKREFSNIQNILESTFMAEIYPITNKRILEIDYGAREQQLAETFDKLPEHTKSLYLYLNRPIVICRDAGELRYDCDKHTRGTCIYPHYIIIREDALIDHDTLAEEITHFIDKDLGITARHFESVDNGLNTLHNNQSANAYYDQHRDRSKASLLVYQLNGELAHPEVLVDLEYIYRNRSKALGSDALALDEMKENLPAEFHNLLVDYIQTCKQVDMELAETGYSEKSTLIRGANSDTKHVINTYNMSNNPLLKQHLR